MDDFEYLDICCSKWELLPEDRRTRNQQCVVDVVTAIAIVEGDGLHGLWRDFDSQMERIVESFRLAGIEDVARTLSESWFCREVIAQGMDAEGHWRFSSEQDAVLSRMEKQISSRAPDAREALLRFLPQKRGLTKIR